MTEELWNGLKKMVLFKQVTAPLTINDMDDDLESKSIYLFDYDKSKLKGIDLLNYIEHLGLVADIKFEKTPKEEKFQLLKAYMDSNYFHHFTSFNVAIMNCIYRLKDYPYRHNHSCLTLNEESEFAKNNSELLSKWICFFDSYFIYMLLVASNTDQIIKERYSKDMITTETLGSTVVSLLLDDFFYEYFKSHIDENNIKYWKTMYDNKLYDNKSFNFIMLNPSNWVFKILHDTATNKDWNEYLAKHLQ